MATAAGQASQPGHDALTTVFLGLLATGVFAILAGISDDMGKVMLVFMWGIVLGWMLLHTSQLGNLVKDL